MLPSLSASIQAFAAKEFQTVITENASNLLDEILRSLGESFLTEAFHYAKASELDEIDFPEIQAATRVLLSPEIWKYAASEGTRYIMRAGDSEDPDVVFKASGLSFPLIDIYNAMKGRDATVTVSVKAAVYLTSQFEFFAAEVIELSAKKAESKEVTEQVIRDAIEGDDELKAIFFPSTSTSETSEADEASALLNEIIDLLHIDRSTLKGVSEEEIMAIEEKFELPLPSYLRSLLKISNGSMSMGLNVFLFPSLSDMEEQFFYNSYLPKIYRINRWIPYQDLDYDFCWEILDVRTGGVILQFDLECESSWQNGKELKDLLTLMKRLKLFRDYLLSRDDKESLKANELKFDDGRAYEKSQGYESIDMLYRFKSMYDYAYGKAESALERPSKKKARK
mmetsp:Transcript_5891/g.6485  ORF Transcript_5891/g.6485 Transcript_5891/m.6485 type:complete len:395 (+) Transcript_5891:61-1245(+)